MLDKKPYTSPAKRFVGKCEFLRSIHEWLSMYFETKRIEEWADATDESLGGRLLNRYPVETPQNVAGILNRIAQSHESAVGELPLIVTMRGVWNIDQPIPGYLTMSNEDEWRRTYGDIEIGSFASGDVTDIVEPIWKTDVTKEGLVTNFLREFAGFEDDLYEMGSIVYALGIPSQVSVSKWFASHFKRPDYYLNRVLSSMEKEDSSIHTYIRLINREALASDIYKIQNFRDHLKQITKMFQVTMDHRASLQLIGRTPESYRLMYAQLANSLKTVLENSLETDKEINSKLQQQSAKLVGYSTLA